MARIRASLDPERRHESAARDLLLDPGVHVMDAQPRFTTTGGRALIAPSGTPFPDKISDVLNADGTPKPPWRDLLENLELKEGETQ